MTARRKTKVGPQLMKSGREKGTFRAQDSPEAYQILETNLSAKPARDPISLVPIATSATRFIVINAGNFKVHTRSKNWRLALFPMRKQTWALQPR